MQSKYWILTINNPAYIINETWYNNYKNDIQYLCGQLEKGNNTGTIHYQIYVCLHKRHRRRTIQDLFPGCHAEARKGNHKEAIAYCTKEESRYSEPFTFGKDENIPNNRGERKDLEEFKTCIDSGMDNKGLWEHHFGTMLLHYKGVGEYRNRIDHRRLQLPTVTIIVGPTGTGKSRYCQDAFEDPYWHFNDKWFDGYTGQRDVIIDEFYGNIPWRQLLRMLDRYPYRVEVKGGTVIWKAENIMITSNKMPRAWYKESINIDPLVRRVSKWIIMYSQTCKVEFTNYNDFIEYENKNKIYI